jgi:FAD:protein FMN transferase
MNITRRHALFGCVAMGGVTALAAQKIVTATRPATAFGTTVRLSVSAVSMDDAEQALERGFQAIRSVEKTFSMFDTESEISRLNATSELAAPSAMMLDLVGHASELHRLTQGAFDPSVQPLWATWNHAVQRSSVPGVHEIASAKSRVGWRNVELSDGTLRLAQTGTGLTFNGIAQGYAADLVMAAMRPFVVSAVIDTGEFGLSAPDRATNLAVKHPRNTGAAMGYLHVPSGFIATSGDYATTFTPDFQHHHIFDPVLGFSPRELSAVTVLAPTGVMADGLATAFMVMGRKSALALAETLKGVEILLITKPGDVLFSSGMKNHFKSA